MNIWTSGSHFEIFGKGQQTTAHFQQAQVAFVLIFKLFEIFHFLKKIFGSFGDSETFWHSKRTYRQTDDKTGIIAHFSLRFHY